MLELITPVVSIVIASHRKDYIRKCVDRCLETIVDTSAAEVLVIADYPVEDLTALYPRVLWVYCPDKSIPKKRNIGIERARGEVVGFIDDDCIPFENWVTNAVKYLRNNPRDAGVAGHTIVERREGVSYPLGEFKRLESPSFRTNNIFYRKNVLSTIGNFDERFLLQREDIDLAFSILESGLLIGHCPDVRVLHACREGEPWDLMKNCINRRFDPLLYKKHGKQYRKWIKTPFTPSIGLMLLIHVIFLIVLFYGRTFVGFAAAMEAIGTLAMAMRRNYRNGFDIVQLFCDGASYVAAPLVLLGALVHGSIKFKKLLLF
jgi:glycosyltransferase involved in cell wall biosynthesis